MTLYFVRLIKRNLQKDDILFIYWYCTLGLLSSLVDVLTNKLNDLCGLPEGDGKLRGVGVMFQVDDTAAD